MKHYNSRDLYLRLLGYVRPYWRIFAFALLTMAAAAATEPAFPALMKPLLDGRFSESAATDAWRMPLLLVGVFLLRGLLGFVADYSLSWVSNKVVLDIRSAMFEKLVSLPVSYVDNQSSHNSQASRPTTASVSLTRVVSTPIAAPVTPVTSYATLDISTPEDWLST